VRNSCGQQRARQPKSTREQKSARRWRKTNELPAEFVPRVSSDSSPAGGDRNPPNKMPLNASASMNHPPQSKALSKKIWCIVICGDGPTHQPAGRFGPRLWGVECPLNTLWWECPRPQFQAPIRRLRSGQGGPSQKKNKNAAPAVEVSLERQRRLLAPTTNETNKLKGRPPCDRLAAASPLDAVHAPGSPTIIEFPSGLGPPLCTRPNRSYNDAGPTSFRPSITLGDGPSSEFYYYYAKDPNGTAICPRVERSWVAKSRRPSRPRSTLPNPLEEPTTTHAAAIYFPFSDVIVTENPTSLFGPKCLMVAFLHRSICLWSAEPPPPTVVFRVNSQTTIVFLSLQIWIGIPKDQLYPPECSSPWFFPGTILYGRLRQTIVENLSDWKNGKKITP